MTNDADILPSRDPANLKRLGAALTDLEARIRSTQDPDGIAFEPHPALLASMAMLNMTTRCGDLDLTFTPAGLGGYEAVHAAGVTMDLGTVTVRVAGLDDIIRSKTTANRAQDRAVLPILHALREEIANTVAD